MSRKLRLFAILAVVAAVYVSMPYVMRLVAPSALPVAKFATFSSPDMSTGSTFTDGTGRTLTIADFKGSYALVNIWATWCPPCREEMASLNSLVTKLADHNVKVVPVSVDVAGVSAVRQYLDENKLTDLSVYNDASTKIMEDMRIVGIPTTILFAPDGREIGRMIGPAQWDSPESLAHILEATGT